MAKTYTAICFAAALGAFSANTANAGAISGSFKGIVTSSQTGPGGNDNINGQTASGTFAASFDRCEFSSNAAYPGCFDNGYVRIALDLDGQHLMFISPGPIPYVGVSNQPGSQMLTLIPGVDALYAFSQLTLEGLPDAFVKGLDYTGLHPGAVIASGSTLDINVRRDIIANIQLTSVQVNGVPEPAGGSMILFGAAALAAGRSRRRLAPESSRSARS